MRKSAPKLGTVRTVASLRRRVADWHRRRKTVALVPTMGALHAGHLALVAKAKTLADHVVVTLFVNPTQFGPNEDFRAYPRDESGDRAKLRAAGVDLLYAPDVGEMYPEGFATSISPGPMGEILEGRFRPGHFNGVATVVTKLLLQAQPDFACFGEKDYQQLQVIRRAAGDLDIPARIVGVKTERAADGLALSSRNVYLSREERLIAPALHQVLAATAERLRRGTGSVAAAAELGFEELERAGFSRVDYLEICNAHSMEPLQYLDRPARVLAAVWLDPTRLIDNEQVAPPRVKRAPPSQRAKKSKA